MVQLLLYIRISSQFWANNGVRREFEVKSVTFDFIFVIMSAPNRAGDKLFGSLKKNEPLLDLLIRKITPRLFVLLLITGLSLATFVLALTVYQGGIIQTSLFKLDTAGSHRAQIHKLESENEKLRAELKSRGSANSIEQIESAISLQQFNEILAEELDATQVTARLRELAQSERQRVELESNFYYKLFLLEQEIRGYGDFISTHIDKTEHTPAYRLIQSVLEDLGFYDGAIDGDQESTALALITFQVEYNRIVPEGQGLSPLGYFGIRTMDALRNRYRSREP